MRLFTVKIILYIKLTKLKLQFMSPPQKYSLWYNTTLTYYILHLIIQNIHTKII